MYVFRFSPSSVAQACIRGNCMLPDGPSCHVLTLTTEREREGLYPIGPQSGCFTLAASTEHFVKCTRQLNYHVCIECMML